MNVQHCAVAVASLALSGCAQLAVDGDGTRHLWGCMVLSLPPADAEIGGDVVRMRSVGLAVVRGDVVGASVTLGYSDTTLAAVRNNRIVSKGALLDPQVSPQGVKP